MEGENTLKIRLIEECFNLFEAIGSTASRLEKEGYIKKGMNNPAFRELVEATYNPFKVYNIKKVPPVPFNVTYVIDVNYDAFLELLGRLQARDVTGNEALENLAEFLSRCDSTEIKWYSKVLQKDLKIGMTDKSVNKVEKGFIPTFDCMLAHPFKKFPKRFTEDRKLDGYRCLGFHYDNDTVELYTRNGHLILGYTGIEHELQVRTAKGFVYDGEIMARDGSFNSTQKDVFKLGKKDKDGVLNIFDMVPVIEFRAGKGTQPLYRRQRSMTVSIDVDGSNFIKRLEPSEIFTEDDEEKVMALYNTFLDEGYEGGMIKDIDAVYECKRTYSLQKLKPMETIDLVVIGVEEGKKGTALEGTLGALIVDFEGNPVNVGSGFKIVNGERDDLWARRNDLIDRTIEIKYQEITSNQKGTKSLRFPTFVKFRDDK